MRGAVATQLITIGRCPPILPYWENVPQPCAVADRDRTVSQRSKPSSRTALIGEQPNPWDRLQPQDAMSRHRGAKQPRRFGLLGVISLLSLAYLLSVDRRPCRAAPPGHYGRLASLIDLSVSQPSGLLPLRSFLKNRLEPTCARPRYSLGGGHPSQTTSLALGPPQGQGGISLAAVRAWAEASVSHGLPPMLICRNERPAQGYSKGAQGLSV